MESRTHWKKLFNYEYLGAHSLEENEEREVTIKSTGKALVKSAKAPNGDECPTVIFNEFDKPMVLNATNCKLIAEMYGNIVEDWVGKKVTIYVQEDVKAFGTTTDALRIKKGVQWIEMLKNNLKNVSESISKDELEYANRIINNKEKSSYNKLHKFLKSKI